MLALATCRAHPQLDPDNRLLHEALTRLGVEAMPAVWDDPTVAWERFEGVVVRSVWDYQHHRPQFTIGHISLQVFHAAIRGDDQALWWHVWQGGTDALGHDLRGFRSRVVQVQDAEDDGFGGQGGENRQV